MKSGDIGKFFCDQLSQWPLACANFRALKGVVVKKAEVGGLCTEIHFNPARIISSAAKTDAESLNARKCFLCAENRPAGQSCLKFEGRKGKKYDVLVNPYPIFPEHFVIAADKHVPQTIWKRYVDLLDLAKTWRDCIFFYNGPHCGASAPDHHHFQGARRGMMPLERDIDVLLGSAGAAAAPPEATLRYIDSVQDADLFHYKKFVRGIFVIRSKTAKSSAKLFYRLLDCAPVTEGDDEPRFNFFAYHAHGEFRTIVIFRTRHRSHHYFSEGPDHLTMSPGCADMAGLLIAPVREEFDRLNSGLLSEMLSEVTLSAEQESGIIGKMTRKQTLVEVGIMSGKTIRFEMLSDGAGIRQASLRGDKIEYDGALYDELFFGENTLSSMFAEPAFRLYDVEIGKNFHWEKKEDQVFAGALRIIVDGDALTAVNVIGAEDYLVSVISSEMNHSSPPELLKAHAVISRSWLAARIAERGQEPENDGTHGCGNIKWYGRTAHSRYDVCADDHCQRYQGLTRAIGETVRKAVDATWGEILVYGREICDARYSKCCGGKSEIFPVCWEDTDYPYLKSLPDTPGHAPDGKVFCDTSDGKILASVLNDYDLATKDFYEWSVSYGRDELSSLVEERSGLGLGRICSLEALERGESGRICRLLLKGSTGSAVVGKELEIRRILSRSHLKSSAFEIEFRDCRSEVCGSGDDWTELVLCGRGWGHGVGLCQIGAAVMASEGCDYNEILRHYYPGAETEKR